MYMHADPETQKQASRHTHTQHIHISMSVYVHTTYAYGIYPTYQDAPIDRRSRLGGSAIFLPARSERAWIEVLSASTETVSFSLAWSASVVFSHWGQMRKLRRISAGLVPKKTITKRVRSDVQEAQSCSKSVLNPCAGEFCQ